MDFKKWIKEKGRPWILTPLVTIILFAMSAIIFPFVKKIILNDENRLFDILKWLSEEKNYRSFCYLLNIAFIIYATISMKGNFKPIGLKKGKQIKIFMEDKFGPESELAQKDGEFLKEAINKNLKQFYRLWLVIWLLWLLLYVVFWLLLINEGNRVLVIFSNALNISTSLFLFFMYRMLSKKTVKKTPNGEAKDDLINFQWIFGFALLMVCDMLVNRLIKNEVQYVQAEFFIKFIIGIFSSIGVIAVAGKLNSKFINMPNFGVAILYFYAAIQVLYPFDKNIISTEFFPHPGVIITILTSFSLLCKIFFYFLMAWIFETGRLTYFIICESNLNRQEEDNFNDFSNSDIF